MKKAVVFGAGGFIVGTCQRLKSWDMGSRCMISKSTSFHDGADEFCLLDLVSGAAEASVTFACEKRCRGVQYLRPNCVAWIYPFGVCEIIRNKCTHHYQHDPCLGSRRRAALLLFEFGMRLSRYGAWRARDDRGRGLSSHAGQ